MITPSALERWGYTAVFGSVALFLSLAAVANVFSGTAGDVAWLFFGAVVMLVFPAFRWVRFVTFDEAGVTFRNWLAVRSVPWTDIEGFTVRRLRQSRGVVWVVVARRRGRRAVTLRATARPGSRPRAGRDRAAAALVEDLAATLERARPFTG